MRNRKEKKGIAAIEVMVIIAVLVVASAVTVSLFLQKYPVDRENITIKKLNAIKRAITGDPEKIDARTRLSFGFVGDLGVPPSQLVYLLRNADPATGNPLYPSWQQQAVGGNNPLWYGWHGPYLNSDSDLVDAWGNAFEYEDSDSPPVSPLNNNPDLVTWPVVIRSNGPDGISGTGDEITLIIEQNEVRNFIYGGILTRALPHTIVTSYNEQLSITYPNGTALAVQTVQIASGQYNSTPIVLRIPTGNRYLEVLNNPFYKIASLNGYGDSIVNFFDINTITPPTGDLYERTFYSTDKDTGSGGDNYITEHTSGWVTNNATGNYYADEGRKEYRAVFGRTDWEDYRLEVDATLYDGRGYGIYYRSDGLADITGYCFQYDPGLASGGGVSFVVRKVYGGSEQSPFQRADPTLAQFPNVFNASHRISITVEGNHHIIKVDGNEIFNFLDNDFLTGMAGFRSWDGQHYTDFHHVLVYEIPPLATGELVWWSFEEGGGETVYGSGFLIGAPELNGTIMDMNRIDRNWDPNIPDNNLYGQSLLAEGHRNGRIDFGDVVDLRPGNEFTISAWVRLPNINTSWEYAVISKVRGNGRGWILRLLRDAGQGTAFGASFSLGNRVDFWNDNAARELKRLNDLNGIGMTANEWYHIAVTYDGSPYSGNTEIPPSALVVYLTPRTSNVVTTPTSLITLRTGLRANTDTAHGNNMRIGSSSISRPFQGYIDEVRIYTRALTASEVNDVFQKHR